MVKSHFFDLDTLMQIKGEAWVVDKDNPSVPILKISSSDFNLIENGIYRKQNNKIEFNGKTFWLPTELFNKIKIKAKNSKANFGNLAISLQEFYNKGIIDEMNIKLNLDIISKLKNTQDDIYIICSKQTKKLYQTPIQKLESELQKIGLKIKNFYFISDNLYKIDNDEIRTKKLKLILQHLIGYKTDGFKFIDEELTKYSKMYFYDNEIDTLKVSDDINNLLELILQNTQTGLKDVIKEDIIECKPQLFVNKINENLHNQIETKKVILSLNQTIKKFESFNQSFLFFK
jgi:hypothetical protein